MVGDFVNKKENIASVPIFFPETFGWCYNFLYLCTRFSEIRRWAMKERVLWKDLHKQRSSTRSKSLRMAQPLRGELGRRNEPFNASWTLHQVFFSLHEIRISVLNRQQLRVSMNFLGMVFAMPWRWVCHPWTIFYNGEFDPGSGWTLATGLTHASRGAAWGQLADFDGDRRTGE